MKCYANQVTTRVLNIPSTAQVTVTTNSPGLRLLPAQNDRQTDDAQDFRFVTNMDFAGGATTPSAQLFVQGSIDGVTWIDLANGTSRTAAGNYREVVDASGVALLPYLRGRVVIAGGTPPSVNATIDIVSNGPFNLIPA